MPMYEYVARDCGCDRLLNLSIADADTDPTKHLYDEGQMACEAHGNVYRRVFSPRMSKYRSFSKDGEREFTTPRSYARYLREQSDLATERTGIPHDFQPVDLRDPRVAPEDDAGLKEQHDAQIKRGEKESKGRFVHDLP